MSTQAGIFHPALRVCQIWGTREGVGKTVASSMLIWAAARAKRAKGARDHVGYLKPLTVGPFDRADHEYVRSVFNKVLAGKALPAWFKTKSLLHIPATDSVSDQEKSIDLRKGVIDYAAACATDLEPPGGWLFVETLNGVESSLPPGKCQADVYQPLRLPAILVSDGKYGLDETMGAFEALRRRDYDVQSVLIFKDPAENHLRIAKRFDELGITNLSLRKLPEPHPVPQKDTRQMKEWYSGVARSNAVKDLLCGLYDRHNQRAKELAAGDKLAQAFETIPEDGSARGSKLRFSFAVPGKHKHCV